MLNVFEESIIKKNKLPLEWQSSSEQIELEEFLQQNWEQRKALFEDSNLASKQQFLSFSNHGNLRTNNYVGTISYKGEQLNIFPKVFKEEYGDTDTSELTTEHFIKNLIQWLDYCSKIDYPYINIKSELDGINDLRELFITVFVRHLEAAFERSAFFQYENITDDLSIIRGKVNIKDYYLRKYPNGNVGKFECTYSSFEYDNLLNKIIKYVCKRILSDTRPVNQKRLRAIISKLSDVSDVRCEAKDCDKVVISKMNENYRLILSLCKMFLLNSTTNYSLDRTKSFCFLFPMELLFEGFIGGFIKSVVGQVGKVKLQASDMSLVNDIIYGEESYGKAFKMKHDILCEIEGKGIFILDTKYKEVPRFELLAEEHKQDFKNEIAKHVDQGDLYQIAEYAVKRDASNAYLLYPLYRYEENEPKTVQLTREHTVDGVKKTVNIFLVRLPFVFEDDINDVIDRLKSAIKNIFK